MVSDKGNNIDCVKVTVWVKRDGSGFVELTEKPGTMPANFKRKGLFNSDKQMPEAIQGLVRRVRDLEKKTVQLETTCTQMFFCEGCEIAFYLDTAELVQVGIGFKVACPKCGNMHIRRIN